MAGGGGGLQESREQAVGFGFHGLEFWVLIAGNLLGSEGAGNPIGRLYEGERVFGAHGMRRFRWVVVRIWQIGEAVDTRGSAFCIEPCADVLRGGAESGGHGAADSDPPRPMMGR